MTPALWGLRWSPPSMRARWALRVRGVAYREVVYIPSSHMALRLLSATGRATVPVLFADREVVAGSAEIAAWGDARGEAGTTLFPAGTEKEIAEWTAISDELFSRSRDLFGPGFARDRDALLGMVDPAPLWARFVFPFAWRVAGWSFGRRYDVGSEDVGAANVALRERLVRAEEKRGGRTYLLGDGLTFADLALATMLGGVRPPPKEILATPDAVARQFTTVPEPGPWDPLFAWRDEMWRRHAPAKLGGG